MICSRGSLLPKGAIQKRNYFQNYSKFRLQHMRRAITRTCLCTHLKPLRCAKKSMPCLIKKASRCAADCMSKTTVFLSFTFYITQRSYEKIMCIYLFDWFSGENCIIFTFSLHKGRQTWQIKEKHEWWNNCFSDVFTHCLNLKHFASLFFLTKDNFIFWIKVYSFYF